MNLGELRPCVKDADQRRLRAWKATRLCILLEDGDAFAGDDWAKIDALPAWVALNDDDLDTLCRLTGTLVLAPLLRTSIDGEVLRQAIELVGRSWFDQVVACELPQVHRKVQLRAATFEGHVSQAGADVLLSLVTDEQLGELLQQRFDSSADSLSPALATTIFAAAVNIIGKTPEVLSVESHMGSLPDPDEARKPEATCT